MSERIVVEHQGGVAHVRLSRADKLNALDMAMFEALVETGSQLCQDASLRAVVISGEGRGFCAGLDFSIFAAMAGNDSGALLRGGTAQGGEGNFVQQACTVWQAVQVPVIAAVHGVAYGGGFQIALGADMRHVHPEARLSLREIEWGIVPDLSGIQFLRHLVPLDVAKELVFTGRVVSGTEAKALGLATHLSDDPLASAMTVASEIAKKSPDAVRVAKTLLNESQHLSFRAGLRREEELQLTLIGRPNQLEAVKAGLEKRPPQFANPEHLTPPPPRNK